MVAITPTRNQWSDEQRITVLTRIELGESQRAISRETGIPQATIASWHRKAQIASGGIVLTEQELSDARPLVKEIDWTGLWGEAGRLGAMVIARGMREAMEQDEPIRPKDLQHLAISAGIATDKHLDYRDGRKGTQINVDARSVQLPPGLTVDELRALALGTDPSIAIPEVTIIPPTP